MKRREVVHRDVFGALIRETWSGDSVRDFFEHLWREQQEALTVLEWLDEVEIWATDNLVVKGWPAPWEHLEVSPEGGWAVFPRGQEMKAAHSYTHGHAFIKERAAPLSLEYFLVEVAQDVRTARDQYMRGQIDHLFFTVARLGGNLREAHMRHKGLRFAESGKRQIDAGRRGNAMRTSRSFKSERGAEAERRAQEIAANRPDLTWAAIRGILAKEFRVSAETIKKTVPNPKKGG